MAANKKKGPFGPIDHYADYLGALEGNEFQDHVCFRLGRRFTDFQPVPANPGGDGGVDGLSHGLTQGYCCYGPERAHHHTTVDGDALATGVEVALRVAILVAEVGGKRRSSPPPARSHTLARPVPAR